MCIADSKQMSAVCLHLEFALCRKLDATTSKIDAITRNIMQKYKKRKRRDDMDEESNTDETRKIIRKFKKHNSWTDTAEDMLVELWEDKIVQLRDNRKNQHVYAVISAELQKNGFSVSALHVKNKVHNLSARYRKEKQLIGPSGGSPSQWPLYLRLHCMLGSFKFNNVAIKIF